MPALSERVEEVSQGRQVCREREVHVNLGSTVGPCEARHAEREHTLVKTLPDKPIGAARGKNVPVRVQNRFVGPSEDAVLVRHHLLDQTVFKVSLPLALGD